MSAASAALLAGALWIGSLLPGPWWLAAVTPALLVAAALVCCGGPLPAALGETALRWLALLLAAVALVGLGSGLAGGRVDLRDGGELAQVAAQGRHVDLVATVVSEPRQTAFGWWQIVRVTAVDEAAVRSRALLRGGDDDEAPSLGAEVAGRTRLRPADGDGLESHARRLGAAATVDAGRLDVRAPPGGLIAATNRVRARTRAAFDARLDAEHATLLAGLVIGDREGRTPERAEQFAATSLTHLVVVSGRHVAVLLGAVLALTALLRLGARGRRVTALVVLAWFIVLVRWQPSVLRAGAMASLVLGAGLTGRGHHTRHSLAMAVLLLLLVDPLLAGQLGFVLSVAATTGVLVGGPWLADRLPGPRPLRLALGVTIGAQVGASPVLVHLEGGVPLGAVPANLVAVPAAGVAQTIGLAAAALAQLSEAAGALVARLAAPALAVVLWAAETFSHGPELTPAHLLAPLPIGLALAWALRRRVPRIAVTLLAAAIVAALWPTPPPPDVAAVTVTLLDVGQGDAVLVEAPADGTAAQGGTARMLIDGGPDPERIRGLLAARRIDRLDAVVLTHGHYDHAAGLPAVLDEVRVDVLLTGPSEATRHDDLTASADAVHAAAGRNAVPVTGVHAGQTLPLGAATVAVLGPPADGSLDDDLNESSVVLRVDGPHGRVLLTGDAEEGAQRRLLSRPEQVRAEVHKVPHHGAASHAEGFFEAVAADVALIGVGRDNDYGHPHPALIALLDDLGTETYRSDVDGTVTVRLTPRGPVVERRRRLRAAAAGRNPAGRRRAGGRGGRARARMAGHRSEYPAPCGASRRRRLPRVGGRHAVRPQRHAALGELGERRRGDRVPRVRGRSVRAVARGRASRAGVDKAPPRRRLRDSPVMAERPPIHLVTGPAELLVRRAADRLCAELGDDAEILEVAASDLGEHGLPDLRTTSLFGTLQIVRIRQAQALPKEAAAALVAELDQPTPPATPVVLEALSTGKIQTLAKRIKAIGGRIDVKPPADWDERGWRELAAAEIAGHGREAERDALDALLEHAGTDVAVLAEKATQVAAATPAGRRIAVADVERSVVGHGNRGSFAVADAMCDRDPGRALTLLHGAIAGGDDPVMVLGALAYRIRSLVAVAASSGVAGGQRGRQANQAIADAAKELGVKVSAGQVGHLQGARRNFGPGELTRAYRVLADADVEVKSGELPAALVLEHAVSEIATRR